MENELISVVVLAYNSSPFIQETLESFKRQTWENKELIIADDASKDDTVKICRNWLNINPEIRGIIVTAENNSGLPANCNRGVKASSGSWIKIIAGDDVMLDNNLEKNITFCKERSADICFSDMDYIDSDGNPIERDKFHDAQIRRFFGMNRERKIATYLKNPIFLNVPTEFFSRNLYNKCGGFDERIPLLEDQPFFYRVFFKGFDFFYYPQVTVLYRKHGGSTVLKPKFVESVSRASKFYREPILRENFYGKIILLLEESIRNARIHNKTSGFRYKLINFFHYQITKF